MCSEKGATLIETLVAGLAGVALVVSIGVLGGNLIRHRANADSSSAAISLATQTLETIRAETSLNPLNPTAADCAPCTGSTLPPPDGTCPRLCPITHGPFPVDESNTARVGGPYEVSWDVFDDAPKFFPDVDSKRVVVRVTHANNPTVQTVLETYLKVSPVAVMTP